MLAASPVNYGAFCNYRGYPRIALFLSRVHRASMRAHAAGVPVRARLGRRRVARS